MGAIGVVLLVAFVIVCVLLVLLVLVQENDNKGMGSMFGGGNSAAFGSHSASVLTKTTVVFVVLFFVTTFALAFINKKSSNRADLSETAKSMNLTQDASAEKSASDWWKKDNTAEQKTNDEASVTESSNVSE